MILILKINRLSERVTEAIVDLDFSEADPQSTTFQSPSAWLHQVAHVAYLLTEQGGKGPSEAAYSA